MIPLSRVAIKDVRVIGENKIPQMIMAYTFITGLILMIILFLRYITQNKFAEEDTAESVRLRLMRLSFVLVFLVLMGAPWIKVEFGLFRYQHLDENRNKLEKPKGNIFIQLYKEGESFGKAYEKYFNDNFGMRDFYIPAKESAGLFFFQSIR